MSRTSVQAIESRHALVCETLDMDESVAHRDLLIAHEDRGTLIEMVDELRNALERFTALRNGKWRGEFTAWENAAHEHARRVLGEPEGVE